MLGDLAANFSKKVHAPVLQLDKDLLSELCTPNLGHVEA